MSDKRCFLDKVHIQNYLSLRDVRFALKPLTVIVGPNASGKSNIVHSLDLLKTMMIADELPSAQYLQDVLWAGEADHIEFELEFTVKGKRANYRLRLTAESDPVALEELLVNDVKVISIKNGNGEVRDEDAKNPTKYRSNKLALKSAGDYGNKPVTGALTAFIKGWQFYDFDPDMMRSSPFAILELMEGRSRKKAEPHKTPHLDAAGGTLKRLLDYWHENKSELFQATNDSLERCTNLKIDLCPIDGEDELCLQEGYKKPIPLRKASDGTLRLIAYYVLLNQPDIPPLIAIEEPERNLHPAVFTYIANALEQLAERTQVIITTHSSQLLDAFNSKSLSDAMAVLLLQNRRGVGTQVMNLEEARQNEALEGWIQDFGIGSAIFDSELLQMEES